MGKFFSSRVTSFSHAFRSLFHTLKYEKNSWIHLFVTIVVIMAGFFFKISQFEWMVIILTITGVWTAELINTALENTVDLITIEKNSYAKTAKDVMAAMVLVSAIGAIVIGMIIFIPYIF